MEEHTTHNRVVGGSNPPTATTLVDVARVSGLLDGRGMLVALSGGPDSTALLLALRECGVPVVAAHFDHRLRPDSAAEAEAVAAFCRKLKIRLISGRRREELPAGSLQAAARELRYRFLQEARTASGLDPVALGHTADDLVEGCLLHLLRGAGLAGMRGMPERRDPFVRPLLRAWRTEIEAYLAAWGVEPLRDPSNADERFARVRVRVHLLPSLERDRPGITRRIHGAALVAAALQAEVEAAAARLVGEASEVPIAALREAPAGVRAEVFRRLFTLASGRSPSLGRRHLAALFRLLDSGSAGQSLDLPGGIRIRRGYQCVQVIRMSPSADQAGELLLRSCDGCDEPRAVHFRPGLRLELGCRRPGLRFRPTPAGSRKLQDVLVDAKVPRHLRDTLPLVFADGELAWVPGIAVDRTFLAARGFQSIHAELAEARNVPARIDFTNPRSSS